MSKNDIHIIEMAKRLDLESHLFVLPLQYNTFLINSALYLCEHIRTRGLEAKILAHPNWKGYLSEKVDQECFIFPEEGRYSIEKRPELVWLWGLSRTREHLPSLNNFLYGCHSIQILDWTCEGAQPLANFLHHTPLLGGLAELAWSMVQESGRSESERTSTLSSAVWDFIESYPFILHDAPLVHLLGSLPESTETIEAPDLGIEEKSQGTWHIVTLRGTRDSLLQENRKSVFELYQKSDRKNLLVIHTLYDGSLGFLSVVCESSDHEIYTRQLALSTLGTTKDGFIKLNKLGAFLEKLPEGDLPNTPIRLRPWPRPVLMDLELEVECTDEIWLAERDRKIEMLREAEEAKPQEEESEGEEEITWPWDSDSLLIRLRVLRDEREKARREVVVLLSEKDLHLPILELSEADLKPIEKIKVEVEEEFFPKALLPTPPEIAMLLLGYDDLAPISPAEKDSNVLEQTLIAAGILPEIDKADALQEIQIKEEFFPKALLPTPPETKMLLLGYDDLAPIPPAENDSNVLEQTLIAAGVLPEIERVEEVETPQQIQIEEAFYPKALLPMPPETAMLLLGDDDLAPIPPVENESSVLEQTLISAGILPDEIAPEETKLEPQFFEFEEKPSLSEELQPEFLKDPAEETGVEEKSVSSESGAEAIKFEDEDEAEEKNSEAEDLIELEEDKELVWSESDMNSIQEILFAEATASQEDDHEVDKPLPENEAEIIELSEYDIAESAPGLHPEDHLRIEDFESSAFHSASEADWQFFCDSIPESDSEEANSENSQLAHPALLPREQNPWPDTPPRFKDFSDFFNMNQMFSSELFPDYIYGKSYVVAPQEWNEFEQLFWTVALSTNGDSTASSKYSEFQSKWSPPTDTLEKRKSLIVFVVGVTVVFVWVGVKVFQGE